MMDQLENGVIRLAPEELVERKRGKRQPEKPDLPVLPIVHQSPEGLVARARQTAAVRAARAGHAA